METTVNTMRDLILDRFERYSERVFLTLDSTDDRQLTYRDMQIMTSRAMQVLHNCQLERGECVTVALKNSPEFIALLFAALATGMRLVILGPNYTVGEVITLHRDLPQRGLFVDVDNLPVQTDMVLPPEFPCFTIGRGSFSGEPIRLQDVDKLGPSIDPSDVAYIMCSSGSTGKPKRICISSRNMLAEIGSMARAHGLTEHDRHLCVLPLYHASGLFRNILIPFYLGGSAVVCETFDQRRFWGLVEAHRINFVQLVPSILALLFNHEQDPAMTVKEHLKHVGSASAPLSPGLRDRFEQRFGIPVFQAYGLTETTCGITLDNAAPARRRAGSVGRPLDVNKVMIVDDNGKAVPSRQTGEVVVQGMNVMEGYLGVDGKPVSPYVDGWFHTNDLGYVDEDGYVYLTGRKSDIINRGAHKISPVEVEEVFRRHPQVRDVIAVAVPHELLGEDLVAYVVRAGEVEGKDLLHFAGKLLPSYKVPSSVHFIEQIPWSPSGKINRKLFAESVAADTLQSSTRQGIVASGGGEQAAYLGMGAGSTLSSLESEVIRIVAEVFNANPAEISLQTGPDDLREWDSMGHIRLMMAIEEAYGVSFSTADNSSVQSVAELVALLSRPLAGRKNAQVRPGERRPL